MKTRFKVEVWSSIVTLQIMDFTAYRAMLSSDNMWAIYEIGKDYPICMKVTIGEVLVYFGELMAENL